MLLSARPSFGLTTITVPIDRSFKPLLSFRQRVPASKHAPLRTTRLTPTRAHVAGCTGSCGSCSPPLACSSANSSVPAAKNVHAELPLYAQCRRSQHIDGFPRPPACLICQGLPRGAGPAEVEVYLEACLTSDASTAGGQRNSGQGSRHANASANWRSFGYNSASCELVAQRIRGRYNCPHCVGFFVAQHTTKYISYVRWSWPAM